MPGKSSSEDRNEGAMDRAKGRMKEAGGAITGDKGKKSEGRSDQRKAKAKDKKAAVKDLLKYRRFRTFSGPPYRAGPGQLPRSLPKEDRHGPAKLR
jgi:uncharacterized protein YjbJ (UPF0337 family)